MSSQPPVQRKGGSTKRPKGPKVEAKVEPKPTFSRGTIGALAGLVAIAALAIGIGLGGFSPTPKALASAKPSNTPTTITTPSPSVTPSKTPASATTVKCAYVKETGAQGKFVGLPKSTATPTVKTATVSTNLGKIVFKLSPKTPCTENSFFFLSAKKYFDATSCHRVAKDPLYTILQCGDPLGTGKGGPGYRFADEDLAGATYPRGTVAMANSGRGTNGSQFFFAIRDSKFDPNYTPFGRVISGLSVLDAIAAAGTSTGGSDGAPKKAVTITTLRIK